MKFKNEFFRDDVFFGGEFFEVVGYETDKVAVLGTEPERVLFRERVKGPSQYGRPAVVAYLRFLSVATKEEFAMELQGRGIPTDTL